MKQQDRESGERKKGDEIEKILDDNLIVIKNGAGEYVVAGKIFSTEIILDWHNKQVKRLGEGK